MNWKAIFSAFLGVLIFTMTMTALGLSEYLNGWWSGLLFMYILRKFEEYKESN